MLMARSEWGRQIINAGSEQFGKARAIVHFKASEARQRLLKTKSSRKQDFLCCISAALSVEQIPRSGFLRRMLHVDLRASS